MQGFQKCYQRRGLGRAQILAVSGHVAAALDYLADELVLREPHGDTVQRRTSLPAALRQGMTVAALLRLEDERTLPLQGGGVAQESRRHGCAAPRVHLRTPRGVSREMG